MSIGKKAGRPRVAFFDFACCEGCQLAALRLDGILLDMLSHVELVAWREVMSGEAEDYDIAFCEGSILRRRDAERLHHIREKADVLAALGSCATIRCHNALRNEWDASAAVKLVYGDAADAADLIPVRPVSDVVETDYQVLGCPMNQQEFIAVFRSILTGKTYRPPNEPVCVECKQNDRLCVHEKGLACLGPLIRRGCGAACPAFGEPCRGCRGLIDDADPEAAIRALASDENRPDAYAGAKTGELTRGDIMTRIGVYDAPGKQKDGDNDD